MIIPSAGFSERRGSMQKLLRWRLVLGACALACALTGRGLAEEKPAAVHAARDDRSRPHQAETTRRRQAAGQETGRDEAAGQEARSQAAAGAQDAVGSARR